VEGPTIPQGLRTQIEKDWPPGSCQNSQIREDSLRQAKPSSSRGQIADHAEQCCVGDRYGKRNQTGKKVLDILRSHERNKNESAKTGLVRRMRKGDRVRYRSNFESVSGQI